MNAHYKCNNAIFEEAVTSLRDLRSTAQRLASAGVYRTEEIATNHPINSDQYAEYNAVCVLIGNSQASAPTQAAQASG